jgi:hypothetical protein
MSSCDNYSEDDFEDDFEDLTETGTPATLDELQEAADDATFLEHSASVATEDKKVSRTEKNDDYQVEESPVHILNQVQYVTEDEPMSRQKRWSEICKASDCVTTTTTKNNNDGAKIVAPRQIRKRNKTDKSLAVKQQREKKIHDSRDRHKKFADREGKIKYCSSANKSFNRTKEDSSREKTFAKTKLDKSKLNASNTENLFEKIRHQKKQNKSISKVAEIRKKEKRRKHRKKIVNRIKKRNRLNHPASYGHNNKIQNESLSLKKFLAMKPSPALPTFKYSQPQLQNNTPVSYVSSLPSPIRIKKQPSPSIMSAIPKAIREIHAKLSEKDLHLKAKERALHACENALIARENAITIRENAIEQKILRLGLHEYDPKNFNENVHGENKTIRSNLLPSFAANTRCPRNNVYDEESATNISHKNSDRNSCCTINNKAENHESSSCCKRNIEVDSENMTDPESMSSQLLHLFKVEGAETKEKLKATTDANHICDDVSPATPLTKGVKNIVNDNSNNYNKTFLPVLNEKNQFNNLKKQKRNVILKEKLRISRKNKGKKYSGLYSVGRPSLSNFI